MNGGLRGTRSPWYVTPLVAVSVMLGFNGLVDMVEFGDWIWTAAFLLGAVALAVAVTRMLSRSRLFPTVVGLAVAVLLAVPAFAVDEAGQRFVLPTPGALRGLGTALHNGLQEALDKVPPADVERPLLALLMAGAFAVFLVAEHLAVSWRAAAASGLVLLLPWMPAIALQHRLSVRLLLAGLAVWILMMALTKRPTGVSDKPAPFSGAVAAMASLSLALLVVPTALGGNGWGMIPRLSAPDQFDQPPRLNLELDLRNSLTVNTSSTVAVYLSSGAKPDALRLYTLTTFDGSSWTNDADPTTRPTENGVLWPVPVSGWEDRQLVTLSFSVLSAESSLPLPTVPRQIQGINGSWAYAPSTDQVLSDDSTTAGLEYTVLADLGYFTAERLAAADASQDPLVDQRTLELPEGVDRERFAALAREITDGSTSRLDQAIALQEYFRGSGGFVYDTTVQPGGSDAVSTFLDDKHGYCVQFATAMVMLARSLDIPARLAVGYLPGSADETGAFVVRGGDAHAWPEADFADQGWVRFEPTPAQQTGARPAYTVDPAQPNVPIDDNNAVGRPSNQPVPSPGATSAPTQQPATGGDTGTPSVPWLLVVAFAVVAAAVLLVAGYVARRRRVDAERATDPEVAWRWLRQHLDPAYQWPLTLTPHESARYVVETAASDGVQVEEEALGALDALALAVSDHRYAPDRSTATSAELDAHAVAARDGIARAVAEATGRPLRAGARGALRRGA